MTTRFAAMVMFWLLAGVIAGPAFAAVRVVDGDTIEVDGVVFRLFGIDAPEAGQQCNRAGGGKWPCGKAAIAAMENLVLGRTVVCDNRGDGGYGRVLAVCQADSVNVNEMMVRSSMAWSFRKYAHDYNHLEDEVRSGGLGIWQAPTQTAWAYREEQWSTAAQQAPQSCPIKGNISERGHIYHAPWSPWYAKTSIDLRKGERWFCDEAEAVAAGWRAPYWGR